MPTAVFDILEAETAAQYLGDELHTVGKRAILSTAIRIVQRITCVIIPKEPRQPVDRGAYRAAWKAEVIPEGAIINNSMPYSSIIEDGAQAKNIKIGRAMIKALAAWALRKGLVKKGKGAKGKAAAQKSAESVAWAIAKNMKKKGIFNEGSGLKILEKAMVTMDEIFSEEVRAEITRGWE